MSIESVSAVQNETGHWVVTSSLGQGLQRYWFFGGQRAAEGLYQTSSSDWAYVRPEGYVVRGAYRASNGYVYIADNDGRVPSAGWVVGNYGQGLQRYWVDAAKHACVPGYSTAGWAHYTTSAGYVLRGAGTYNGKKYYADNDGRLASGWVVTAAFGQGLQRYWLDPGTHTTVAGYSAAGWAHYTTSAGYVLRNSIVQVGSTYYAADNDGKLSVLSARQAAVIRLCRTVPSPGRNLCAEWVERVYQQAGIARQNGNACDEYAWFCHSSNRSELQPGMVVAVGYHGHTWAGHIWGHVGIYAGGGVIYDNVGRIRSNSVDWWISYYGSTGPYGSSSQPRWGWYGNVSLA